ncbi:MAG: AAA family ATPase, partial [Myxococcales bacterium]|nr:AAA family ATPase [Myxococcales bacterium]
MLTALRIRNLAIVEALDATFEPGLTVVTGETGAGKSILVHALQLVLGGRSHPELVRAGAERGEVEALLDLRDDPEARALLRAMDLPADDEVVLRRTLQGGRSRATVNGSLATAAQLQRIGRAICDITSQHEHHSLSDPATHLSTLDGWIARPDLVAEVKRTYDEAASARTRLLDLQARAADRADRCDLLRFQLTELRRLEPQPGELDELEALVARSRNAGRLLDTGRRAESALLGRDRSIAAELARVEADLRQAAQLDPALAPLASQVGGARLELEDAGREIGAWLGRLDVDPEEAARAEERLAALRRVARRHGSLEEATAWRRAAEEELAQLEEAELHLDRLERELRDALEAAGQAARELS